MSEKSFEEVDISAGLSTVMAKKDKHELVRPSILFVIWVAIGWLISSVGWSADSYPNGRSAQLYPHELVLCGQNG